ncbi:MAG TPA: EamA family transporter [Bacteroidia bacterium]|jgi:drug/metabolite transporter (DMT)-like permease|nr:EamA family transporter [Bacteroidia bacterium]
MGKIAKAHLSLLAVNLIYGANYSIVKKLEGYIDPFALVLIRAVVTMLLFWASGMLVRDKTIEKKDFRKLLLLGLFGVAINQLLFIKGLFMGNAINASIIMIFSPIVVILIEVLFLKKKAPLIRIVGILIGIAGAVTLLLFKKPGTTGNNLLIGDILILINCIAWSVYMVMVKPLMLKYKTVTVVKWVFLFGAIYVLPFAWSGINSFNISGMGASQWACMAYVVVGSTFIAYFLNTYALTELSASVAATYIYLQPVVAALFAVALNKDTIDAVKIVSALLIIIGIFLVSRSRKEPARGMVVAGDNEDIITKS